MKKQKKPYHDGEMVIDFLDQRFRKDLRMAKLPDFPNQRDLQNPLDEVLWILWVIRDRFDHYGPSYASEISELLEIRGIALTNLQVERALARAGNRVIRKKFEDAEDNKKAYSISEKGIQYLKGRFTVSGVKAVVVDGTKPWTDRHLTLPEIAQQLKGEIQVLDKFYGIGSLSILNYFKHGSQLKFLTGRTNESHSAFANELKSFRKEVPSLEVRVFPNHSDLHDRYILTDEVAIIVGHGIKDVGQKESFLIILKGDSTADLRKTLNQKFQERWGLSSVLS